MPELSMSSSDHVNDQEKNSHKGSDDSKPSDRIKRYVKKIITKAAENLSYSMNSVGLSVIMSLFVDDGVPTRSHRLTM
jgi:uncharacterized protein YkwD